VQDDHLASVAYRWDGDTQNTTLSSPYEIPIPTGDGVRTVYVYATDGAGNEASKKYVFLVNDNPPQVTGQSEMTVIYGEEAYVSWDLSDAFSLGYTVYVNGTFVVSGAADPTDTVQVSLVNLDVGTYNYTITVTDEGGLKTTAVTIVHVVKQTTTTTITTTTTGTTSTTTIPTTTTGTTGTTTETTSPTTSTTPSGGMDWTLIVVAAVAAVGVIVVVVIVFLRGKGFK